MSFCVRSSAERREKSDRAFSPSLPSPIVPPKMRFHKDQCCQTSFRDNERRTDSRSPQPLYGRPLGHRSGEIFGGGEKNRSYSLLGCETGELERMAERTVERRAGEAEIDTARTLLRLIVADLKAVRGRLVALHASISPSPEEIADVDLPDELDVLTEIRTLTVIALRDRLDPLIETLSAAAAYRQTEPTPVYNPASE
jgi:hypothetical protein